MVTVLESLNAALRRALATDERVYLLGEDLLDPYGGAFKVTRGLSTAFPERVIATPVSEAGIAGLAAGMSLRGLRPVVEIMFGDFIMLVADQLVNHISKFRWMYSGGKEEAVQVPLVIRTPMGGRRGYGPTHSQSLEKLFLGVPGLRVLAASPFGDPGELLFRTITETSDPVLFIENKLLYTLPVMDMTSSAEFDISEIYPSTTPLISQSTNPPIYRFSIRSAPPPSLTIATYGYMAELVRQAALQLAYEHEVFVDCLIPTRLSPIDIEPVLESARRTRRLLVVEEGALALGWGAEILARSAETPGSERICMRRVGALDLPVPASKPLEDATLPGIAQIVAAAMGMVR